MFKIKITPRIRISIGTIISVKENNLEWTDFEITKLVDHGSYTSVYGVNIQTDNEEYLCRLHLIPHYIKEDLIKIVEI